MTSSELFKKINYQKAYRKNRLEAAQYILDKPECFREVLEFCFKTEDEISYKAAWALEFVCLEKMDLLLPHLDYFFENIPKLHKDQSLRPMAKICATLCELNYKTQNSKILTTFTEAHKKTLTECCFDWLITEQKVACQVHAMQALYYLGEDFNWIHPELKIILEANIFKQSAGYKARAKKIISKI